MTQAPAKAARSLALVEDNGDDIELFRLLLKKAGVAHPAQIYKRAEEFMGAFAALLRKSAATLPLICFLDLALPDVHGLELVKWIRSHPHFDPVSLVVVSASEHPQDIRAAGAHGAQCYLAKYPQPRVLRRVVDEATGLAPQKIAQRWFGIPENLILRWGFSAPSAAPA